MSNMGMSNMGMSNMGSSNMASNLASNMASNSGSTQGNSDVQAQLNQITQMVQQLQQQMSSSSPNNNNNNMMMNMATNTMGQSQPSDLLRQASDLMNRATQVNGVSGDVMIMMAGVQNNLNTLMSMLNSEDCDEDFWKKMLPEYEKDKYMPSNHAFMGPKN